MQVRVVLGHPAYSFFLKPQFKIEPAKWVLYLEQTNKTMRDTACLPYVTTKRSVIGLKLLIIFAHEI